MAIRVFANVEILFGVKQRKSGITTLALASADWNLVQGGKSLTAPLARA